MRTEDVSAKDILQRIRDAPKSSLVSVSHILNGELPALANEGKTAIYQWFQENTPAWLVFHDNAGQYHLLGRGAQFRAVKVPGNPSHTPSKQGNAVYAAVKSLNLNAKDYAVPSEDHLSRFALSAGGYIENVVNEVGVPRFRLIYEMKTFDGTSHLGKGIVAVPTYESAFEPILLCASSTPGRGYLSPLRSEGAPAHFVGKLFLSD